ncbi:MAG: orotidine-5'-phosphate decarboxylase [Phycisphaeraceae bacterium]|nr:MAG: orotidine-5'-phosphate decarboxylase [Phycisphaeraceae bacterium]
MTSAHTHPADELLARIAAVGSPICVGLDPVVENLPRAVCAGDPHDSIAAFSLGVIEAVAPHAAAIKFQSACYERYGSRGFGALERACAAARHHGLFVLLDAKRGDIGLSAAHYAAAASRMGAHAVTVNGYLGPSGIEPFLAEGLAVFVLVRTSNPDSDEVQSLRLADGRTVAESMADLVATLGVGHLGRHGLSSLGAVVGATKSADGHALRARMPDQIFLVPGYGAQGGKPDDIRALLRPEGDGVLVTASRSVIYPPNPTDAPWNAAIAHAARRLADEIRSVCVQ